MALRGFAGAMVVLVGAGVAGGQEWARAMFEELRHDLGVVARGSKIEHVFTFTNPYVEDVRIASIRSTCACTVPEYPEEAVRTYETGRVVAAFDTRRFLGRTDSTLTVVFDEPFPAEVQLYLECYIRGDVVLQPGKVEFGSVSEGETARREVSVRYAGRGDWQLLDVENPSEFLDVVLKEAARDGQRVDYNLVVTLGTDAPSGYLHEEVILVSDDEDRRKARVPVQVEALVVPSLSVRPASLTMGVVRLGESVTRNLVVQSRAPVEIVAIECDDGQFRFAVPEGSRPLHVVPVTFTARDLGRHSARVVIRTDAADSATAEAQVHAQVTSE